MHVLSCSLPAQSRGVWAKEAGRQGGREAGREVASLAGPRARLGAGGWRVRQAVPVGEGAAHRAGQEDLPFVALFFNPFLSLLVFIAHIFPVTVSPGFHPFQGAIFSPR